MLLENVKTGEDTCFSLDNLSVWGDIGKDKDLWGMEEGEVNQELQKSPGKEGRFALERNRKFVLRNK